MPARYSDLGRFYGVDPKTAEFPGLSAYQYSDLNPIMKTDIFGMNAGEWEKDSKGDWKKVSTVGDRAGVDFYHTDVKDPDGNQLTVVEDNDGNRNIITNGKELLANAEIRDNRTNWLSIFKEWRCGYGPVKSIFEGKHPANIAIMDNYKIYSPIGDFKNSGASKRKYEVDFYPIVDNLYSGGQMQSQMMGSFVVSLYRLGEKTLTLIQDQKTNESFYYHLPFVQSYERGGNHNRQGNTDQLYLFLTK